MRYFIGKVQYKSKNEIIQIIENTTFHQIALGGQNKNFAELLCIKRNEFKHESEVRVLINDLDDKKGDNRIYKIDFAFDEIIDEICLDPRLTSDEFHNKESELQRMGISIPIIKSDLYQIDLPRIKM